MFIADFYIIKFIAICIIILLNMKCSKIFDFYIIKIIVKCGAKT